MFHNTDTGMAAQSHHVRTVSVACSLCLFTAIDYVLVFIPLGMLADRAVCSACVQFFLLLMISWRAIISGSTGPIFVRFSPITRCLVVD